MWALPFLYLYAFQIYFDFSGYTDIARGLALLFGFRWPENFDRPYLAASVREFWRRWHITLSRFLRDYVYRPLGGNRGSPRRTAGNLMATMLIGGLWHGGSWSFVVWGGVHGAYLLVHRAWSRTELAGTLEKMPGISGRLWQLACIALTFQAVCLAWSFFRVPTIAGGAACLRQCLALQHPLAGGSADASLWSLCGIYAVFALAARGVVRAWFDTALPPLLRGASWGTAVALLGLAILLAPSGPPAPFIYFQF